MKVKMWCAPSQTSWLSPALVSPLVGWLGVAELNVMLNTRFSLAPNEHIYTSSSSPSCKDWPPVYWQIAVFVDHRGHYAEVANCLLHSNTSTSHPSPPSSTYGSPPDASTCMIITQNKWPFFWQHRLDNDSKMFQSNKLSSFVLNVQIKWALQTIRSHPVRSQLLDVAILSPIHAQCYG